MDRKEKRIEILSAIMLVITSMVLFYVHRQIPFMMDDLWYSTNLATEQSLQSFGDIIGSQVWHFHNWGGRCITHGLLQCILMLGEPIADVLNVIATLVLGYMISVMAGVKRFWAVFASIAMVIGLNANWQMSMFWESGAANYLYITSFILLFLWCYLREDLDKKCIGITFWIVPLGIIAGWSNENMGPMAWILCSIVIGYRLYKKEKTKAWMWLGNVACLFGSVMVVVAPGNFVRSAQVKSSEYGLLWQAFLHGYEESRALLNYLFPVVCVALLLVIICRWVLKIELGRKNKLLLLGALLSWGAMALSPHYPDRATFGTMVLLICVILSLFKKILDKAEGSYKLIVGMTGLIWLRGMFYIGEYVAILWGWIK